MITTVKKCFYKEPLFMGGFLVRQGTAFHFAKVYLKL